MTSQHPLSSILAFCLIMGSFAYLLADEPELTAEEEAAILEQYPNFKKIREIERKTIKEIVDKLRQFEASDPLTMDRNDRNFATEVIAGHLARSKDAQVTLFLLDWLEFRRRHPLSGSILSVSNKELYPAFGVLTQRGMEIVPQLLEHAVAGPRSSSYGYRARSLLLDVIPDEVLRKKAIDDFAAQHPDKKEALAIFTPPLEDSVYDREKFLRELGQPDQPKTPAGRWGDIYVSVGQWKRMVIDAKKDAPPKDAPPPPRPVLEP